jgi:hypothetical protein
MAVPEDDTKDLRQSQNTVTNFFAKSYKYQMSDGSIMKKRVPIVFIKSMAPVTLDINGIKLHSICNKKLNFS